MHTLSLIYHWLTTVGQNEVIEKGLDATVDDNTLFHPVRKVWFHQLAGDHIV